MTTGRLAIVAICAAAACHAAGEAKVDDAGAPGRWRPQILSESPRPWGQKHFKGHVVNLWNNDLRQ